MNAYQRDRVESIILKGDDCVPGDGIHRAQLVKRISALQCLLEDNYVLARIENR